MQDFAYFKSLYPAACKQMQLCVEAVCDELEYEGSPIYDEYPDRIFLEKLTKRALEKWQKVYPAGTERADTLTTYIKAADVGTVSTEEGTAMVENSLKIDSPGGEREENLAGTSIQPHLPGNDVWYGSLRGEQKGGNAGYMVWEADEPNLTAQERRPWSPPPGPRPGGPGNPWGPPPPPPGPRPGGPGNPWEPPPPPLCNAPDTGKLTRTATPAAGTASGETRKSVVPPPPLPDRELGDQRWGARWFADFQVLLMNELQERRRCRKC